VHQLYIILLVDHLLYRYEATHIQLHAAPCDCCVRDNIHCLNADQGPYFRWQEMQCRGGLTGVCVAAVSQPGAHWIKRPSFGSIEMESHLADMFVEP
jgi:hypothetical protein